MKLHELVKKKQEEMDGKWTRLPDLYNSTSGWAVTVDPEAVKKFLSSAMLEAAKEAIEAVGLGESPKSVDPGFEYEDKCFDDGWDSARRIAARKAKEFLEPAPDEQKRGPESP